jgi:hypothetical protein
MYNVHYAGAGEPTDAEDVEHGHPPPDLAQAAGEVKGAHIFTYKDNNLLGSVSDPHPFYADSDPDPCLDKIE